MKKFKITVNGKAYEVEVEEMGGTPVAAPAPQASAPAPAPAAPAPAPAAPASTPAPAAPASTPAPAVGGPIPDGKAVKRGDIILVLEAMKMQNDITATADGTLHEIRVNPGDNVKTGDVLAVIVK